MGALSFSVTISGTEGVMQKLAGYETRVKNVQPALQKSGKELKAYYSGIGFESGGGEFGVPWASLSPRTVAYKAKHFAAYSSQPLMRTGKMKESFTYKTSPGRLKVTNSMPYFVYHQSTETRHKIPRRAMLGINDPVKQIIKNNIKSHINGVIASIL